MNATKRHLVILGGGFAGFTLARALEAHTRAAEREALDVTLVARDNYLTFTPMLPSVPSSTLAPRHVVSPLRASLPRTRFVRAEVDHIDPAAKQVYLFDVPARSGASSHPLAYDELVVALGSTTNFFGVPGAQQFGLTMKTVGDAMGLRNRILAALEAADVEDSPRRRRSLATIVIVGVGFSGCETAGELVEFFARSLSLYPHVRPEELRIVIVGLDRALMPELPARLGQYAKEVLERQGVEVRLETAVTEVAEDHVMVRRPDGITERIEARTVVWTAGIAPHPCVRPLTDSEHRGRVAVDETLRSTTYPNLWSLGDCAAVPNTEGPGFCTLSAQHAIRQAQVLAHNLLAQHRNKSLRPYTYRPVGLMASLGHHKAVVSMRGFQISGFFAWWMWRTYYLSRMPGTERKLRVALDWTLDLLLPRDTVLLPFQAPTTTTLVTVPLQSTPPPPVSVPVSRESVSMLARDTTFKASIPFKVLVFPFVRAKSVQ